jgi:hypothetical protein
MNVEPQRGAAVGVAVDDIDSERIAEFIGALEAINRLPERFPGFVWRLTDGEGDGATGIKVSMTQGSLTISRSGNCLRPWSNLFGTPSTNNISNGVRTGSKLRMIPPSSCGGSSPDITDPRGGYGKARRP